MRRWVLLLMVLVPAVLWAGAPSGPRIYVPEVRYDFGAVKAGDKLEHLFLIRNDGTGELVIRKVSAS
ncbi:MAG: DUF1573 domain-containing protein [Nitrospirota bacterium]|nr:DUF1573 domain-containing protein [Nitrospirota bacterium]